MLPKNTKCRVKDTAPYFAGRIGYFQFLGTGQAAGVVILSETPITDQVSPGTMLAGSALMSVDHTDVVKLMEISAQDLAVEETPIATSASTDRDKRNFVLRHKRARPHQYAYSFNPDSKTTKLDHAWILSKALYVQIIFNDPSSAEDWEDYELVSMYDAKQAQADDLKEAYQSVYDAKARWVIRTTTVPCQYAKELSGLTTTDLTEAYQFRSEKGATKELATGWMAMYQVISLEQAKQDQSQVVSAPSLDANPPPKVYQPYVIRSNQQPYEYAISDRVGGMLPDISKCFWFPDQASAEKVAKEWIECTAIPLRQAMAQATPAANGDAVLTLSVPKDTQVCRIFIDSRYMYLTLVAPDCGYSLTPDLQQARKLSFNEARDQREHPAFTGSEVITLRQALEDMIRSVVQGTTASPSSQDQDRLLVDIQYPKDTQVYRWTNPTGGHMYVRQDDIYYKGYGLVIELRDATKFPSNFPGRDQLVSEKIPGSYAISFRQALKDVIRSLTT